MELHRGAAPVRSICAQRRAAAATSCSPTRDGQARLRRCRARCGPCASRSRSPQRLENDALNLSRRPVVHQPDRATRASWCRRVMALLAARCRCCPGGRSSSSASSCGAPRARPTSSRTSSGAAATSPSSTSARTQARNGGALEHIFEAGFREFAKHRKQGSDVARRCMDGTRRAMRATYQREMDALEAHLSFLATVGSVSPYIGLFGTVWGIMNAFRGLANVSAGDARARRARHRRGADRDGDGPVRRDPGGGRLQPLHRTTSTASRSASRRSWKSSPTSCSGRCTERCHAIDSAARAS